jgi:hypothetical protein
VDKVVLRKIHLERGTLSTHSPGSKCRGSGRHTPAPRGTNLTVRAHAGMPCLNPRLAQQFRPAKKGGRASLASSMLGCSSRHNMSCISSVSLRPPPPPPPPPPPLPFNSTPPAPSLPLLPMLRLRGRSLLLYISRSLANVRRRPKLCDGSDARPPNLRLCVGLPLLPILRRREPPPSSLHSPFFLTLPPPALSSPPNHWAYALPRLHSRPVLRLLPVELHFAHVVALEPSKRERE